MHHRLWFIVHIGEATPPGRSQWSSLEFIMEFGYSESLCQLRFAIYGGRSDEEECPGEDFDYEHATPMFDWSFNHFQHK